MELVRWQPLSGMVSLREAMDRLFEERFAWPAHSAMHRFEALGLPIDMYQTDKAVVVKATVPGVKPEEIDISITGDTLTIKGETKAEEEVEKEDYFRRERRYGTFTRTVILPDAVETDKARRRNRLVLSKLGEGPAPSSCLQSPRDARMVTPSSPS